MHILVQILKSLSLIAIPSKSDSELVWLLHFTGCRRGQRSLLNSCQQEWTLEAPKVELPAKGRVFLNAVGMSVCMDALLVVGLMLLWLVEENSVGFL